LEASLLSEEAKIMAIPVTDNMNPTQRAWLEKKKILDRDL
jgi:hypothetical protein